MKKQIAYIRTSTLEQSPELQIKDILSSCSSVEIHTEQQSAWAENVARPVFDKILELIKKQQVSDFYCWDLDRVYRNRLKLKQFFILCKTYNCNVHSIRQHWLETINTMPAPFDDIFKELLINFTGWMGEEESQKRSERVKLAVRKKEDGTFSYKGNKWGRKRFPKQTIDRVLEMRGQNKSIREIAQSIFVYDKNNNARLISKSAVHKILVQNAALKESIPPCP